LIRNKKRIIKEFQNQQKKSPKEFLQKVREKQSQNRRKIVEVVRNSDFVTSPEMSALRIHFNKLVETRTEENLEQQMVSHYQHWLTTEMKNKKESDNSHLKYSHPCNNNGLKSSISTCLQKMSKLTEIYLCYQCGMLVEH
jgi:hypothetical protein